MKLSAASGVSGGRRGQGRPLDLLSPRQLVAAGESSGGDCLGHGRWGGQIRTRLIQGRFRFCTNPGIPIFLEGPEGTYDLGIATQLRGEGPDRAQPDGDRRVPESGGQKG